MKAIMKIKEIEGYIIYIDDIRFIKGYEIQEFMLTHAPSNKNIMFTCWSNTIHYLKQFRVGDKVRIRYKHSTKGIYENYNVIKIWDASTTNINNCDNPLNPYNKDLDDALEYLRTCEFPVDFTNAFK